MVVVEGGGVVVGVVEGEAAGACAFVMANRKARQVKMRGQDIEAMFFEMGVAVENRLQYIKREFRIGSQKMFGKMFI